MTTVTTFLIDVWHDLQEKRLWPVAVGLLAAIVAVPFVLFKPTSPPPAQSSPTPKPTASQLPVVNIDNGPTEGSQLKTFIARNPFKPLSDLGPASSSASATSPSTSGATGSSVAKSTATAPPTTATAATAATAGTRSPSGGASPSTASSSSPAPAPASNPVRFYQYVLDLRFGKPGHLKTMTNVPTLTMLPNAKQPVVVFMGVSNNGQSPVFFIADPGFRAHGKGSCNASGAACRFVTLSPTDGTETFSTADGSTKYQLQVVSVNAQVMKNPPAPKSKVQAAPAPGAQPSAAARQRAMASELEVLSQLMLGGTSG